MIRLSSGIFLSIVLFSISTASGQSSTEQLVADGMMSFSDGQYTSAKDTFEQAAYAGNAQAQTKLAEMYENGLGVPRSYVHAYAWYNHAAVSGNVLARSRRDALETRMTKSQISEAQTLARDISEGGSAVIEEGVPGSKKISVAYTFGLFSGQPFNVLEFTAFRPNATALQMVKDILSYNSIPSQSFQIVETMEVPNAAAGIQGSDRYILYNPLFMRQVAQASTTPWEAYSIMAHEIGHHLAGHTIKPGGSRPPFELEADLFSGGTLARMGASREEAIAAMMKLGSPTATASHPARDQRVAAISQGWEQARKQLGGARTTPDDTETRRMPTDDSPPQAPRNNYPSPGIARACMTPFGGCPLMSPLIQGNPCTCFTPTGGMFSGIAQ